MRSAKIIFLIIPVVATVGGALAFKAQRFADRNVFCKTNLPNITCTKVGFKYTIVSAPHVTTPCLVSHQALGISTTGCYSTYTCPLLIQAHVTTTIIE